MTGQAATTDPSTVAGSGDPVVEVFLSPRVVDRDAFDEFAGALRDLIREASRRGNELRGTTAAARDTIGSIRSLKDASQARVERIRAVLAALEQRTEAAQRVAEELERNGERTVDENLAQVQQRLDERLAAFEARLDEAIGRAEQRMSEIQVASEQQVQSLEARLERAMGPAGQVGDRLDEQTRSARDVASTLEADLRRITGPSGSVSGLIQRAGSALKQLDALRGQADQARALLGKAIIESAEQIDSKQASLDRIRSDLAALGESCRDLERRIPQRRAELESALAVPAHQFQQRVGEAAAAFQEMVGRVSAAQRTSAAMLQEHRALLDGLDRALTRIEPWRSVLLEPDRSGNLPEPIRRLVDQARSELSAQLREVGQVIGRIADEANVEPGRTSENAATPPPCPEPGAPDPSGQPGRSSDPDRPD